MPLIDHKGISFLSNWNVFHNSNHMYFNATKASITDNFFVSSGMPRYFEKTDFRRLSSFSVWIIVIAKKITF